MDSGVSQPLLNPFIPTSRISRSPPRQMHSATQQQKDNAERMESVDQENHYDVARENADLKKSLENLMQLNGQLYKEVQQLKEEIAVIKNEKQVNENQNTIAIYDTDEDELAYETSFIRKQIVKTKRQNKKRKAESSPEVEQSIQDVRKPQSHQPDQSCKDLVKVQKNVPLQQANTSNVIKQGKGQENEPIQKEIPPPPINILNVSEYETIKKIVKLVPNDKYNETTRY